MALRLCSYNIEWFDDLFTKSNTLKTDADSRPRQEAIRDVLQTVNGDVIGIVEAPNTTTTTGSQSTAECLENFSQWAQLRTTKVLTGFISHSVGWTEELFRDMGRIDCEGAVAVSRGKVPANVVNREVLERPGFKKKLERYAKRSRRVTV